LIVPNLVIERISLAIENNFSELNPFIWIKLKDFPKGHEPVGDGKKQNGDDNP
jgi:hypothetical protein